jgi:chemotaxis protein histidine kinase CheA
MSAPLGSADFFALEAGECLDHLDVLISQSDGGDPVQMLRYSRALRGSALMANQTALARAAAGFEALARAIRDGKRAFDAVAREQAAQAVDDVRQLVRRVKEWGPADDAKATRIASELAALAGGEVRDPRQHPVPQAAQAQTGVRAFVAREGALVASALDRAARSLEATPEAREPLYAVLRRMQSLRGLAELSELSPLPEVLDGIELAVGDLTRLFAPPPGVPALLDAAAAALTRIARDVADRGSPDSSAPEAQQFTDRLLRAFASEDDVMDIDALLDRSQGDAIVRSSAQPQFAPPSPLGDLELVSHGEHLVQAAEQLMAAPSVTARDLRLYALVPAFRATAAPGRDPLTAALARFGKAACRYIASGAAAAKLSTFAEILRSAGSILREVAADGARPGLASRLDALTSRLDVTAPAAAEPAVREDRPAEPASNRAEPELAAATTHDSQVPAPNSQLPAPSSRPAVPASLPLVAIESLAYDGESVLAPVAALAPAAQAEAGDTGVVPVLSLAPDDALPIERGFSNYQRLVRAGGAVATAPVPAAPAAAVDDVPGVEADIVNIETLCYSGQRALERAAAVRAEIAASLQRQPGLSTVEPLLLELLDLVPLALKSN